MSRVTLDKSLNLSEPVSASVERGSFFTLLLASGPPGPDCTRARSSRARPGG